MHTPLANTTISRRLPMPTHGESISIGDGWLDPTTPLKAAGSTRIPPYPNIISASIAPTPSRPILLAVVINPLRAEVRKKPFPKAHGRDSRNNPSRAIFTAAFSEESLDCFYSILKQRSVSSSRTIACINGLLWAIGVG